MFEPRLISAMVGDRVKSAVLFVVFHLILLRIFPFIVDILDAPNVMTVASAFDIGTQHVMPIRLHILTAFLVKPLGPLIFTLRSLV